MVPGTVLPSPGTAVVCFPPLQGRRGVLGSSLKNGVFLTVPENQNFANAAKTPRAATFSRLPLVRQAARGGEILAFRGCKKYHRFFQWSPKHPAAPAKEGNRRRSYRGKGGQPQGPNTPPKPLTNTPCRPRRRRREGRGTALLAGWDLKERFLNCGNKDEDGDNIKE